MSTSKQQFSSTGRHRPLSDEEVEMEVERRVGEQHEQQRRDNWHLDKTLNVSHILATLTIASGIFLWAGKTDTRISLVEASLMNNKSGYEKSDEQIRSDAMRQDVLLRNELVEIKTALGRIEINLNSKADKDLVQALVNQLKRVER